MKSLFLVYTILFDIAQYYDTISLMQYCGRNTAVIVIDET